MIDKRRFQRVLFQTKCTLVHDGAPHQGQIENISLGGAMVSFPDTVMIPQGDRCDLALYIDGEPQPLRFTVEVIYSTLFRVGLQIVDRGEDDHHRLVRLMESLTTQPEKLREELKLIDCHNPAPK